MEETDSPVTLASVRALQARWKAEFGPPPDPPNTHRCGHCGHRWQDFLFPLRCERCSCRTWWKAHGSGEP